MKEFIEKIIEIILEDVSCEHQEIKEYPRGPKQDDPTYALNDEKGVIEQCIKAIPENVCFSNGHDFFVIASKENDHSVFGWLRCSRCSKTEEFQFDFKR